MLTLSDGQGHIPFPLYSLMTTVSSSPQDTNPAQTSLSTVIFLYIAASLRSNHHWDHKDSILFTNKTKGKKGIRSVDFSKSLFFQLLLLALQQPFNHYIFKAILASSFFAQCFKKIKLIQSCHTNACVSTQ